MRKVRTDCFFIEIPEDVVKDKITCKILKKIDCEKCSFYKKKDKIKNNVFYKESFSNKNEYENELKKYHEKYNENIEQVK